MGNGTIGKVGHLAQLLVVLVTNPEVENAITLCLNMVDATVLAITRKNVYVERINGKIVSYIN